MKFIPNHWTRNTYPFAWRLGWRLTKTKPSDWTYLMYCLRKVCLSSICHASSLWCRGWLTGESVGVTTGLFFKPSWLFVLIALRLDTDWPELCLERCDEWKVQFWWFSNKNHQKKPFFLSFENVKYSYHFFCWRWDRQLSLGDLVFLHDLPSPNWVKQKGCGTIM